MTMTIGERIKNRRIELGLSLEVFYFSVFRNNLINGWQTGGRDIFICI